LAACSSAWNPSFWTSARGRSCLASALRLQARAEVRFFEGIFTPTRYGSKASPSEKYCNAGTKRSRQAVEEATVRRWRYMNDIYWYALHGKADNTPTLAA
jgi:hypothetical protein